MTLARRAENWHNSHYETKGPCRRSFRALNGFGACAKPGQTGVLEILLLVREDQGDRDCQRAVRAREVLRVPSSGAVPFWPKPDPARRREGGKGDAASLDLARDAEALQANQQCLRHTEVRSARNRGLRRVGQLCGVQGMVALQRVCRQPDNRPHRQRLGIFARKLPLGRPKIAGAKSPHLAADYCGESHTNGRRVVRGDRNYCVRHPIEAGSWVDRRTRRDRPNEGRRQNLVAPHWEIAA